MGMSTACCARAFQRGTSRLGMHVLLTLQEVMPISKTRNQVHLIKKAKVQTDWEKSRNIIRRHRVHDRAIESANLQRNSSNRIDFFAL